jgi:hypothetical protein
MTSTSWRDPADVRNRKRPEVRMNAVKKLPASPPPANVAFRHRLEANQCVFRYGASRFRQFVENVPEPPLLLAVLVAAQKRIRGRAHVGSVVVAAARTVPFVRSGDAAAKQEAVAFNSSGSRHRRIIILVTGGRA